MSNHVFRKRLCSHWNLGLEEPLSVQRLLNYCRKCFGNGAPRYDTQNQKAERSEFSPFFDYNTSN